MPRTQAWWALAVSLGLHAVPLAHALGDQKAPPDPVVPEPAAAEEAVVLPGDTFDIDASGSEPAVPTPAASEPAVPTPAASEPAVPTPAASELPPAPARAPVSSPALRPPPAAREVSRGPASAASTSGSYGEETASVGAASVGKGLLRVLPRVSYPEPTFHQLPFGTTVVTLFSVDLDESGHVTKPPRFDGERVREPWFEALVVRALLLLRAGTFALAPSTPGRLEHRFELEAQVVEGQPKTGDWLEPSDLAEIGRLVEPTAREPGHAHFVYNSGREVRLTLKLVPHE
jgi:hypothetical protein